MRILSSVVKPMYNLVEQFGQLLPEAEEDLASWHPFY